MSDYYDAGSKPITSSSGGGPGILGWINTALQGAQSLYQMWAQKKTWAREDTAIQRRVADLKAAGLNPVLAAGGAAQTSAPIQVTAPQVSMEAARNRAQIGVSRAERDRIEQEANKAYWDRQAAFSAAQSAAARAQSDMMYMTPLAQAELERRKLENAQTGYMLDWYSRHGLPYGSANSPLGKGATVADWIRDVVERMREHPETMGGSVFGTQGGK